MRAADRPSRPARKRVRLQPNHSPSSKSPKITVQTIALAGGDTDIDLAAWAFSLLGHKASSHTVTSDNLSFLLTISRVKWAPKSRQRHNAP